MDTIEALLTRRSIRKYKNIPVDEKTLSTIIKTGMYAPSAGNQQPWHFIVLNDRDIMNRIPIVHPYSQMIKVAPVAIVVCGDTELEKHKGYWEQDCSAATQNLCLAAHALGVGNCWLGVYPREDRVTGIKEILELPENIIPFSIVVLGFPDEEVPLPDRYNPTRIRYNKW